MEHASQANKENSSPARLFSSPQKTESLYTQRQRRPPTITPKRFTRFFTPRPSQDSSISSRQSRLDARLRDVTFNSANGVSQLHRCPEEASCERPTKRLKRTTQNDTEPLRSSPIREATNSIDDQLTTDKDVHSAAESSDDEDACATQPAAPIQRLSRYGASRRLLLRTFGDTECRPWSMRNLNIADDQHRDAQSYVTRPEDMFEFRKLKSLPFCTAPCNNNSLVAIGDELGAIHMLDTAPGTDFAKQHIVIKAHQNAIMDMSFSSDDYVLATTSGDQTVRVIDVQTQQEQAMLLGHCSSIKQVYFRPDNDKLLTTSARDGFINIWDLRCTAKAQQNLYIGTQEKQAELSSIYPYRSMLAGPAQRASNAREVIDPSKWPADSIASRSGVSITAIQHLTGSRSHLLMAASEQNSSLKLYDLRTAGRNTKSDKYGFEIPVSSTPTVSSHRRPIGVSSLALSTDGARAYSVCKDSTVWVYSTQHLILGSAPEMIDRARRTRLAPPDHVKEALGPLYGLRHPKLRVGTFYTKAAVRKAGPDQEEMLAVGSQDMCPVLFSTADPQAHHGNVTRPNSASDRVSRRLFTEQNHNAASPPVYKTGTALVRGHRRDVTSLAFAHGGELVTVGDDFYARCWRQDEQRARELRKSSENKWRYGWAEASASDDSDDLE